MAKKKHTWERAARKRKAERARTAEIRAQKQAARKVESKPAKRAARQTKRAAEPSE
jgi:hypothetical protein